MKLAILGFGQEGKSLLKFLKKSQSFKNAQIEILDQKFGKDYLKNLKRFDIIFRSPGVPYTLKPLYDARCDSVKVSSATKLFFELAAPHRQKLIGITGTKGKGTTATLLYRILKAAGKKVLLAGNIGKPMLDIMPEIKKVDYVILELSSFQLQDLPASPHIALILDVFPDHLDQHKTLREYYGSKANIGRFQKKSDAIFYFTDNQLSKNIAFKSPAKKFPIFPKENNLKKNYEMAAAVAEYLGCPPAIIEKTVKNFQGLEHRLELVRAIKYPKKHSNILQNVRILFYNDSAATNPEATAAAIETLSKNPIINNIILIAGGKDKNLNYAPLAKKIRNSKNVKAVILFGENKNKIKRQIAKSKTRIVICENLGDAIKTAFKQAKSLVVSGYTLVAILFSPASASFDMFRDYRDRGRQFKKIIKKERIL